MTTIINCRCGSRAATCSVKEWNSQAKGGPMQDVRHKIECQSPTCGMSVEWWASEHTGRDEDFDSSEGHEAVVKYWNKFMWSK